MRVLALIGFVAGLSSVAGLAVADPAAGFYQNAKGTVLHLTAASGAAFDFTLTAGAPDGAATCPDGASDCLQIDGHALAAGKGFTFTDPGDDRSRVFFAEDGTGMRVLSTTGDFGTGSANRGQMLALTGAYLPVDARSDAVQTDGAMQAGNPPDAAADVLHFFRSPTGNISCLFDVGPSVNVRCDMLKLNRSFTTPPKDCDLEWGDSFGVAADDRRGGLVCHGDTIADPSAEVLDYGSTLTFGGIACVSAKSGMTCQTDKGHGFALSRKVQTVF